MSTHFFPSDIILMKKKKRLPVTTNFDRYFRFFMDAHKYVINGKSTNFNVITHTPLIEFYLTYSTYIFIPYLIENNAINSSRFIINNTLKEIILRVLTQIYVIIPFL